MDPLIATALTSAIAFGLTKAAQKAPSVPFNAKHGGTITAALTLAAIGARVAIAAYTGDASGLDPEKDAHALFEAGGAIIAAGLVWWAAHHKPPGQPPA